MSTYVESMQLRPLSCYTFYVIQLNAGILCQGSTTSKYQLRLFNARCISYIHHYDDVIVRFCTAIFVRMHMLAPDITHS